MEDRLKPCPFCGGEAKTHEVFNRIEGIRKFIGFAIKCGKKPSCCRQPRIFRLKEKAVFEWNTRHAEKAEGLEEIINKFWEDWEAPSNKVYTKELANSIASAEGIVRKR